MQNEQPTIKELLVKDFPTREALENHIAKEYGRTTEKKPNVKIIGTKQELAKLRLSSRNIIWGINCEATDETQTKKSAKPNINRGKRTKFGIDNELKDPPKKSRSKK